MDQQVHPSMDASIEIGADVQLGLEVDLRHFVRIGDGAVVGDRVSLGFNVSIGRRVVVEHDVKIGDNVVLWDDTRIGAHTEVESNAQIGYAKTTRKKEYYEDFPTTIGQKSLVRAGAIIYRACHLGDHVWIGNYTILRENTRVGDGTTVGSHVMCEGYTTIGKQVRIYSLCELGGNMVVEDFVFIGPGTVTANNPKPLHGALVPTDRRWNDGVHRVADNGPTIRYGAKIGIGACLLPEIEIGREALVAAGAVVAKSVPDFAIVRGVPAREVGQVPVEDRYPDPNDNFPAADQ